MADPVESLISDLLEWLEPGPRPYFDVMEAWRTSCPRLPVWEEANARGLVTRTRGAHGEWLVQATAKGRDFLHHARP